MDERLIEILEDELIHDSSGSITRIINNVSQRYKKPLSFEDSTKLIKIATPQLNGRNVLKILMGGKHE